MIVTFRCHLFRLSLSLKSLSRQWLFVTNKIINHLTAKGDNYDAIESKPNVLGDDGAVCADPTAGRGQGADEGTGRGGGAVRDKD